MKITKTQKTVDAENTARIIANTGCDICPNCGESTEMFDYIKKGIMGQRTYVMRDRR